LKEGKKGKAEKKDHEGGCRGPRRQEKLSRLSWVQASLGEGLTKKEGNARGSAVTLKKRWCKRGIRPEQN